MEQRTHTISNESISRLVEDFTLGRGDVLAIASHLTCSVAVVQPLVFVVLGILHEAGSETNTAAGTAQYSPLAAHSNLITPLPITTIVSATKLTTHSILSSDKSSSVCGMLLLPSPDHHLETRRVRRNTPGHNPLSSL